MAGCSIAQKPLSPPPASRLDMAQAKNSLQIIFPKMVSIVLASSYHAGVCSSISFSDEFCLVVIDAATVEGKHHD